MKRIRDFLDTYVDPADQLAQILFGLIMLLTTTRPIKATGDSAEVVEAMDTVKEAIGCNVAWGVITGVLYSMNTLYCRSRPVRLQHGVRCAAADDCALTAIIEEIDEDLAEITTEEDRRELGVKILSRLRSAHCSPPRLERRDFVAGVIVFFLVAITVVTLAPFYLISDLKLAKQLTNLTLVTLMFIVGYCWGRVVLMNPWVAGVVILVIGVAMVGVAEYLGG